MTGVIINNNEYQVSTGSTKIEYSSMGGGTIGYSMYGENIPEESDKGIVYNSLVFNTYPCEQKPRCCCPLDFTWDSDWCMDFDYKVNAEKDKNKGSGYILNAYAQSYFDPSTVKCTFHIDAHYNPNDPYYRIRCHYGVDGAPQELSKNSINYDTRYIISTCGPDMYVNGRKRNDKTMSSYVKTISNICLLHSMPGTFYSLKFYTDITRTTLLHDLRPYKDDKLGFKDLVTNKIYYYDAETFDYVLE